MLRHRPHTQFILFCVRRHSSKRYLSTMNTLWFKIQIEYPFDINTDTLHLFVSSVIFEFKRWVQQRPCSQKVSFWHWWVKIKGKSLPSDTPKLLCVISLWCSVELFSKEELLFTFLVSRLHLNLFYLLLKVVIFCTTKNGFWSIWEQVWNVDLHLETRVTNGHNGESLQYSKSESRALYAKSNMSYDFIIL